MKKTKTEIKTEIILIVNGRRDTEEDFTDFFEKKFPLLLSSTHNFISPGFMPLFFSFLILSR